MQLNMVNALASLLQLIGCAFNKFSNQNQTTCSLFPQMTPTQHILGFAIGLCDYALIIKDICD
jgi:hypothetical protein